MHSRGFIIRFVWVPSHSHIFGNEQADCLAKLGATRGIIYKRDVAHSEYYTKFKNYALNSWQVDWDSSDKGRWCHSILPIVNKKPWFKNLSAGRNLICTFSRLISNHYTCNSHLYRINIIDSNLCDCGETYQDIDHIVFYCKNYILPRKKLINNFKNLDTVVPVSVRDILGIRSLPMIKILYDFFNDIRYVI